MGEDAGMRDPVTETGRRSAPKEHLGGCAMTVRGDPT